MCSEIMGISDLVQSFRVLGLPSSSNRCATEVSLGSNETADSGRAAKEDKKPALDLEDVMGTSP